MQLFQCLKQCNQTKLLILLFLVVFISSFLIQFQSKKYTFCRSVFLSFSLAIYLSISFLFWLSRSVFLSISLSLFFQLYQSVFLFFFFSFSLFTGSFFFLLISIRMTNFEKVTNPFRFGSAAPNSLFIFFSLFMTSPNFFSTATRSEDLKTRNKLYCSNSYHDYSTFRQKILRQLEQRQ